MVGNMRQSSIVLCPAGDLLGSQWRPKMEGICGVLPHYKQRVIKGQVLLSLLIVQSQDQSDGMSPFKLNGISFSMLEPPGNCV